RVRSSAGPAMVGPGNSPGTHRGSIDRVVAGAAVDGQLVGGILMGDDDAGGGADDADAAVELAAVEGKQSDRVITGGAIGRHRVDRAIAGRAAERACEIDQHATGRQISPAEVVDHDVVGAAAGGEVDTLRGVCVPDGVAGV